jgi:predicted amidohydrolase
MREIRIACGQFIAAPGDKPANVARMAAYAEEARQEGCELILFPELIVTGYLPVEQVQPLVEPVTGPSVQALSKAARDLGIAIAFGMAELDDVRGVCHNSLVVLNRQGDLAALYHKVHLWAAEREWAEPGDQALSFEMDSVRYGGWICYDTRFPEQARLSALMGIDVGLIATAWLGPGDEWELALCARALDNSIFVAGADIIGPDPALRCYGRSLIASPKGRVLARAEPEQEGIICATLDPAEMDAQRGRVPLFADRRPELYGPLAGSYDLV